MNKPTKSYQQSLFWVTLLFFALGMIHISLSLVGLLCFTLPFYQYHKYKDKVWCKYYCPRAGMFTVLLSKISLQKPMPKWLKSPRFKKGVVIYFGVNIFFATMSTIMSSIGKMPPVDFVRFLIVFPAPFTLPQLLDWSVPVGLLHFSYRIYSMMFTSATVGLVLGMIYAPRTWCAICPIQTLTSNK